MPRRIARERGYAFVPSFHRDLVIGVATYAYEFLTAVADLDTVYVPIGLGSGICGVIGVRDALGFRPASSASSRRMPTPMRSPSPRATWCRPMPPAPSPTAWRCGCPTTTALAVIRHGAERIVEVTGGRDRRSDPPLFPRHPHSGRRRRRRPARRADEGARPHEGPPRRPRRHRAEHRHAGDGEGAGGGDAGGVTKFFCAPADDSEETTPCKVLLAQSDGAIAPFMLLLRSPS